MTQIARALISVSDKSNLSEIGNALNARGIQMISTGGTAKALRDAGFPVTDVSEITGFPEIMAGRVKTLHPKVHGGLLGRGDLDADIMAEHGITPIDLLIVNLYPFEQTIARADCTRDMAIENIDIGGPAMIRAAAKNHARVAVVVDPGDYPLIISELAQHDNKLLESTRRRLAAKAFAHTATYDAAIWNYLQRTDGGSPFPEQLPLGLHKQSSLRYGENPHQSAALYSLCDSPADSLIRAHQHQGKPLSFNNLGDADAALECVRTLPKPACVIVKHANPCGVGTGKSGLDCYELAYATDPTSAFGGIIAFNVPVDGALAATIVDRQFLEVIVAPHFSAEALAAFGRKPNVRVLATGDLSTGLSGMQLQQIYGGILIQDSDTSRLDFDDLKVVSKRPPNDNERVDALLAWQIVRFVKSNAIVYCKEGATLGVGAGQMSRVMSAQIAATKAAEAHLDLAGASMASDAFFPFRDGIDIAASYGISVVIQPGGSVRDDEIIAAANEHNMAMLFTGMRHFRH
jgi:phosphoribosylaminoimidazolecarboxamide formyltransferase/IMP cyclohydrolase